MLGAVTQVTDRVELMTYVTCPLMRYHPAVVAQKAATIQLLSDDRFTLGLGAGENLNEHVVGAGWPPVNVRHEMLLEAVPICWNPDRDIAVSALTSSSGGSAGGGTSTPSCLARRASPAPASSCGPRTSRTRSSADLTWLPWSAP
jgi:hypothetical protein